MIKNLQGYYILSITGVTTLVYHFKGLSQATFARKAGLHRTYISAIEREKRSIALENIQKVANALEIETHLLFIDLTD